MVDIPPATNHGWVRSDGYIEPAWSEGPILPSCLQDIFADVTEDDASDDELGDADEFDYSSLDSDSDKD